MQNLKVFWLAGIAAGTLSFGACIAPTEGTEATVQAVTGDHSFGDQIARDGESGLVGFSTDTIAIVQWGVAQSQISQMISDVNADRAKLGISPCPLTTCLRVVDENGAPITSAWVNDANRFEATMGLSAASALDRSAKLVLVVPRDSLASRVPTAIGTLVTFGAKSAAIGYGGGTPADQTAFQAALNAHPAFVAYSFAGDWSTTVLNHVPVSGTDYVGTGPDTLFSEPAPALISALEHNVRGTFNGSTVAADSKLAATAFNMSRGANQSPAQAATRPQIQAAAASHFNPLAGSVGRGTYKDGLAL